MFYLLEAKSCKIQYAIFEVSKVFFAFLGKKL